MDLQAQQVPRVEITFTQDQGTNQSPKTSRKERVPSIVDEILSMPTSKKTPQEGLSRSRSSSSGDDSLGSFRDVTNAAGSIMNDLQETLHTLHIKNTEDHLEIFKHIEKVNAERKISTEFNQQMREDFGLLKTKIDTIEKLYKILNDGLTAAQQNEALRSKKAVEKETASKVAQEQLNATLEQMKTNAHLYEEVKKQYNEQATRIEELKKQYAELATTHPLLNQILSTPRLSQAMTPRNQPRDSAKIDEITLEDILTQQQAELLEMEKMIKALDTKSEQKTDYNNIFNDLRAQIATAESKATAAETKNGQLICETQSLMRKVQLWMTASTAVLLASFWFWWQAHKA